jgi:hypothetical protein
VKQLQSTVVSTSQQCHVLFLEHFQIFTKNGILTILLAIFIYMCACDHGHMMVTPHSSQCHDLIVTWLLDPQYYSSMLSESSSPFSNPNCDSVFGASSSSIGVPSLCSTSAS